MLERSDIAFLVIALFMTAVFFMIGDNEIVLGAIVIAAIAFVVTKMKQKTVVMGEI